ncbi:TPM domain-containing protein [Chryseobacterium taiwanense]|uniref:TPM domain-containing protein n=1 Tax=Chryseobacterium taiwanense TaxID=363331 RepID=UPI00068E2C1D|nr:TPM domain-containing protein [Chryseobacterium taiwanense]
MRLRSLKILFSFVLLCFYSFVSAQYTIPEKPAILYPVYDEANLLSQQEKESLNSKLIEFEQSTSIEIAVIIISSVQGEDINFVATMFGEKWKIGTKEFGNGVVLLIAKNDREMSLQQSIGLEKNLTTTICQHILDNIITPHFKENQFYSGIDLATSYIINVVSKKPEENNNG